LQRLKKRAQKLAEGLDNGNVNRFHGLHSFSSHKRHRGVQVMLKQGLHGHTVTRTCVLATKQGHQTFNIGRTAGGRHEGSDVNHESTTADVETVAPSTNTIPQRDTVAGEAVDKSSTSNMIST
jgi:hypothetical protein